MSRIEEICGKFVVSDAVFYVQASVACDMIYFDGSETRGSSNVGIVIKYSRNVRTARFRVWIPELPVDVVLSDNKLSAITGWKIASPPARYISQLTIGIVVII